MKRRLPLALAVQGTLLLSGCLDPARLNTSCEWRGDTTGTVLDLARAADRRHLANDVRIAGENATRYRDSVKIHYGFGAAGRLDDECLDRLYATIAARHGVRRADLDAAATMRDVPLDVVLIYLPMGALFLVISSRLCRRLYRRMPPPGERWTTFAGVVWLGIVASGVATVATYLHAWNVDTVRLRDFHLSFRAAYLPVRDHPWLSYLAALALFAVAGLHEYRAGKGRVVATAQRSA